MVDPVLVTAPTEQPVTLAECKAFMGVSGADRDAVIAALIAGSVAALDGWRGELGRCIMPQTWRQVFRDWSGLAVNLGDVTSIASITYRDWAGQSQTVNAADYSWEPTATGARIILADAFIPPVIAYRHDAVTVTFTAALTPLPGDLKIAIMEMVAAGFFASARDPNVTSEAIPGVMTVQYAETAKALSQSAHNTITRYRIARQ